MKLFNFKGWISNAWPFATLILATVIFFWPFFLSGKLPIPADLIVGLYHPWRDIVWSGYTTGVPFKNFIITDPVRQQFPWREVAMSGLAHGEIPLWNPYIFSGTPLIANIQSAVFYPLNIVFFILPFSYAWSLLVMLQIFLASLFCYLYFVNLGLKRSSACFGALVFAFSGFSIAWLTWNTVVHTLLWLPLILLSIDSIIKVFNFSRFQEHFFSRLAAWMSMFIFSLSCAFLAGHLQTFLYVFVSVLAYLILRLTQARLFKNIKVIFFFVICYGVFFSITSFQWSNSLSYIINSGRSLDQVRWQKDDWFLPWQHLVQFIAPDFFGNPATLNYWGIWNYGEFIGYVGLYPLLLALYSLFLINDKRIVEFAVLLFISLLFVLPTPLAKVPFQLQIPFLSSSQPSRLISIVDFSLAALSAFGFDRFFLESRSKRRRNIKVIFFLLFIILTILWLFTNIGKIFGISSNNLAVSQKNLIFPSVVFVCISLTVFFGDAIIFRFGYKSLSALIMLIFLVDIYRFGWKFTPFSDKSWIYPKTQIIRYLQSQPQPNRYMSVDDRIFPPNFSIFYRIQTVAGYDPLYLHRYGEFVSMWVRGKPDISPLSFNRIITPHDYNSPLARLANVEFVLSLKDEPINDLTLVMQEGTTRLYKKTNTLPRAYFVSTAEYKKSDKDLAEGLFTEEVYSGKKALIEEDIPALDKSLSATGESVEVLKYAANEIVLKTTTYSKKFLVLADVYYPLWKAFIDSDQTKIYRTNFTFRGIVVPGGNHVIRFIIG